MVVTQAQSTQWLTVNQKQDNDHNCPGVKENLEHVDDYRKMETCAFYSQVFGMVIYLLVIQIMAAIKKANNTPL